MHMQWISMVFVNVMWGLSFIGSKHAMNAGFTPMTLALMRYVMAAACLAPATLAAEKKLTLRRRDVVSMVLSGLMGITAYYFYEYNVIQLTSTVSASLILAAIPIITMLVQAAVDHTRLRPAQTAGAVISLVGVGLVRTGGSDEGQAGIKNDFFSVSVLVRQPVGQDNEMFPHLLRRVAVLPAFLPVGVRQGGYLHGQPQIGNGIL